MKIFTLAAAIQENVFSANENINQEHIKWEANLLKIGTMAPDGV